MNTHVPGHDHGGRNRPLGMLAFAAVVLLALLAAGRSLGEALPLAALLACPLIMIGMMFWMARGRGDHQHGGDPALRRAEPGPAAEGTEPATFQPAPAPMSSTLPRRPPP